MKVTEIIPKPTPPPPRTFTLEVTEEELERIAILSWNWEGGLVHFPNATGENMSSSGRIHESVPRDVLRSACRRFGITYCG